MVKRLLKLQKTQVRQKWNTLMKLLMMLKTCGECLKLIMTSLLEQLMIIMLQVRKKYLKIFMIRDISTSLLIKENIVFHVNHSGQSLN